ncbi:bifunctional enoyl-CoA hydratase/phosphate acetyltransferase [uncultured Shimia sp.]|uniref:bifunctional enoyl-CoA hydratase/phosphate acetyltransferase n=1 Tax=uncultured Shimia sp. TaxID=573152 RepID=UPI0026186A3F|nr:bifunctional enoyl-CoA hydratase/phosphate acetyltransferase [uncultured Shimia sp.]
MTLPNDAADIGALPEMGDRFATMLKATRPLTPIVTAVVHPCDAASLKGALVAWDQALISPILVGPKARIEKAAVDAGLDISDVEIVASEHSHDSARKAVELVHAGRAEALMKGALHTDEVMSEVVHRERGLRTARRMSHIFVLDVPRYSKPLLISDAAINIFPDLQTKADIIQNAIELGHALGVDLPKVAILSAVETIYPKIPSTVEAGALCKMADRGQITGGLLDGPLAFDNAVSKDAAEAKGIVSDVAGDPDILIAPDLEAGNMIAKQLMYLAGAESAGIVMGARVPVMLTSRADGTLSRLISAALAQLVVHHRLGKTIL